MAPFDEPFEDRLENGREGVLVLDGSWSGLMVEEAVVLRLLGWVEDLPPERFRSESDAADELEARRRRFWERSAASLEEGSAG